MASSNRREGSWTFARVPARDDSDDLLAQLGRRDGAGVRDEVGDRLVAGVTDAREDRRRAGRDRARHALVVEGREVALGPAAAHDADDVDAVFVERLDRATIWAGAPSPCTALFTSMIVEAIAASSTIDR